MADVHDKTTRSFNMSRIKSKDTKPEMLVRKFLFSKGFRYKLHDKTLAGKPDLVFPRLKTVIFIHGCYWHGHEGCPYFVIPKSRTDWWLDKIGKNKLRDNENLRKLKREDWKVITVFECELKPSVREKALNKLQKTLSKLSEKN